MIRFRKLDRGDLPLVHRWLNTPHVAEWWTDEGRQLDETIAKYSPRIDGKEDVRCFVIVLDDAPIGYIQEYPASENSVGIDLFIGEFEFLHRGLGASIIRQFLNDVVFADPAVESVASSIRRSRIVGQLEQTKKPGFSFLRLRRTRARRKLIT